MTWPALLLWVLIIYALISRGPFILYLFSVTAIFGSLTLAPGGTDLPPQTVCGAILIAKIMLRSDNLSLALKHAADIRKLGLLSFFLVYAVLTAFFFPRIFAGSISLYSLNSAASESLLVPTMANFNEAIYQIISCGIVFAFAVASRSENFRRHYFWSILVTGILMVASGIIDLLCFRAGKTSLLLPFHNAAYNVLDSLNIAGVHRVVGFMPEASVYGAVCCSILAFLVFNFSSFEPNIKRLILPLLVLALVLFTFMSTSSTGYVGLLALGAVFGGRLVTGLILVPLRNVSQLRRTTYLVGSIAIFALIVIAFAPYFLSSYHNLLDAVLFKKQDSSSYLERTRWTHAGFAAFLNTDGIGVGIGSVRTSNWFVNFLASTGIFGTLLFSIFIIKTLSPRSLYANRDHQKLLTGLKLCLIPPALMLGLSGTTPDPGVWMMSIVGIIYGLHLKPQTSLAPEIKLHDERRHSQTISSV